MSQQGQRCAASRRTGTQEPGGRRETCPPAHLPAPTHPPHDAGGRPAVVLTTACIPPPLPPAAGQQQQLPPAPQCPQRPRSRSCRPHPPPPLPRPHRRCPPPAPRLPSGSAPPAARRRLQCPAPSPGARCRAGGSAGPAWCGSGRCGRARGPQSGGHLGCRWGSCGRRRRQRRRRGVGGGLEVGSAAHPAHNALAAALRLVLRQHAGWGGVGWARREAHQGMRLSTASRPSSS
jgi:hypothetical protein